MKKKHMFVLLLFVTFNVRGNLSEAAAKIIRMIERLKPYSPVFATRKSMHFTNTRCRFNPHYECGINPCINCSVPLAPQNNGLTKCLIGQPHYTCEAWPCAACPKTNLPPFARKK